MLGIQRLRGALRPLLTIAALACTACLLCGSVIQSQAHGAPRDSSASARYIVVFEDSVGSPAKLARTQAARRDTELEFVYRHALKGYAAEFGKGAAEALREDPRVDFVVRDRRVEPASQVIPTGIDRILAPASTALDIDGVDDVRVGADVAVLDTRIFPHPDLNLAGRTDCINGTVESPVCINDGVAGGHNHGTHVAGIVGAIDNDFGVVGAAPGVRLWGVRVMNEDGLGWDSTAAAGLDWVTATRQDGNPANDIEVANMSLGAAFPLPATATAITGAVEAGVVPVVAAGNDGANAASYAPANHPDAITVSALADSDGEAGGEGPGSCWNGTQMGMVGIDDDALAEFSNSGAVVDVVAPGVCILSTLPGGHYGEISGTSMAAPYVAGAVATLAAASPPKSKKDVEALRAAIEAAGNLDWTDTSGDGDKEPLLGLGGGATGSTKQPTVAAGGSQVTLRGLVKPGGLATKYHFEYGTSTAYGSSVPVPSESVGSGSSYVKVSKQVNGLQPDTTYHFRIVATNSSGTFHSPDRVFYTNLPVATTQKATRVLATRGELNATVDPRGFKTTYHIEYGPTTSYGSQIPISGAMLPEDAGSVSIRKVVRGLEPEGLYHFRVAATNAVGTVYGDDRTFTTPAPTEVTAYNALTGTACPIGTGCKLEVEGEFASDLEGAFTPPSHCGHAFDLAVKPDGALTFTGHQIGVAPGVGKECRMAPCTQEAWEGQILSYDAGIAVAVVEVCLKWLPGTITVVKEGQIEVEIDTSGVDIGMTAHPQPFGGAPFGAIWESDEYVDLSAPPTAITESPAEVGAFGATLAGIVSPNGKGTQYRFEYGPTDSYGTTIPVPPASAGAGRSDVEVDRAIGGLEEDTTYHYRLVASNELGTTYGDDETFTTPAEEWRMAALPPVADDLLDVACTASSNCIGVGARSDSSGSVHSQIAKWDGSSWVRQPTPRPTGATSSELSGVTCLTASNCIAVGSYVGASGQRANLGMRWNGSTWSLEEIPSPAGASLARLADLACTEASSCFAAGSQVVSGVERAHVVKWNGSSWSVVSISSQGSSSEFSGIACAPPLCHAVGSYVSGGVRKPFSAGHVFGIWVFEDPAKPAGATSARLTDISCSGDCTAVGTYEGAGGSTHAFATRRTNGWQVGSVPIPSGATSSELRGVSCPSGSACKAVGSFVKAGEQPFAVTWNGSAWQSQAVNPAGGVTASSLAGVWCISASSCNAVGSAAYDEHDGALGYEYAGAWELTEAGRVAGTALGISCASQTSCAVVGGIETPRELDIDAAWSFDGAEWSAPQRMVDLSDPAWHIRDVDCSAAGKCTAVGSKGAPSPSQVIVRLDGQQWAAQSAPSVGATPMLRGVACPAATSCVVVGDYSSGSGRLPFTQVWNGSSWTTKSPPVPGGAVTANLNDVTCTSASACVAVGRYRDAAGAEHPLIETWDGSAWSIASVPTPSGGTDFLLNGVSCSAANACTAVGSHRPSSSAAPESYVARWNGSSWQLQEGPGSLPVDLVELNDVDCATATACAAVGLTQAGGVTEALALRWDGATWTVGPTALPSGGDTGLTSVSCSSEQKCAAAGYRLQGDSAEPLVLTVVGGV